MTESNVGSYDSSKVDLPLNHRRLVAKGDRQSVELREAPIYTIEVRHGANFFLWLAFSVAIWATFLAVAYGLVQVAASTDRLLHVSMAVLENLKFFMLPVALFWLWWTVGFVLKGLKVYVHVV